MLCKIGWHKWVYLLPGTPVVVDGDKYFVVALTRYCERCGMIADGELVVNDDGIYKIVKGKPYDETDV